MSFWLLSCAGLVPSEGEGESTTLGMRRCPPPPDLAGVDSEPEPEPNENGLLGVDVLSAIVATFSFPVADSVPFAGGALGSQLTPGLHTKFTVSPSLIVYSLNNLLSASALPFNNNLWASAGGADGCAARRSLIEAMVSVGCTGNDTAKGGLRDLNVSEIEAVWC